MLKLYNFTPSVCSVKARIGLAEMGVDYENIQISLQSGEQHSAEYRAINPSAVVPTLVDGDLTVYESSLILEYVDRHYNGGALMPEDRHLQTVARHWLLRTLGIHAAINTLTFSTAQRANILATNTPEQIAASVAKMPDPILRQKRADLIEHGLASPHVTQAIGTFRRVLSDMSSALAHRPWITGPELGIADLAIVAYIDRLERLGFAGMYGDATGIADWLKRMQARPSYEAAVSSQIDASAAAKLYEGGSKHWPELKALWQA